VVGAVCLTALSGCGGEARPANPASLGAAVPGATTSPSEAVVALEMPPGEPEAAAEMPAGMFVELPVEGFGSSIVWVPPASAEARPLLVAAHGAGGRPEHHCVRWREVTGGQAFLLCTRGHAMNRFLPPEQQGYFYDGHHELGRETLAALASLESHFEGRVDASGAIYAGYSQGATMGALFLHASSAHGARFSRVAMIEGGSEQWNVPLSQQFRAAGGQRVLFVCGQKSCGTGAERSARYLEQGGVETQVRVAEGGGHTYLGAVGDEVERGFAWLIEGDPRWQP
jgi:predicted esterase